MFRRFEEQPCGDCGFVTCGARAAREALLRFREANRIVSGEEYRGREYEVCADASAQCRHNQQRHNREAL